MAFMIKNHDQRISHRLKIARGHLEKVIRMVDEGAYCIDVLLQSKAVQNALKEADNLMMENHLQTCASDAIKKGESEKAISEVMAVLRKANWR